jgi:V/A-type H+-transporting ATPase subunit I
MIIGDAGYGLLLLGTTYVASRWWKDVPLRIWTLFYLLAGATVLWGAMTGVWFGSPYPAQWPVLNLLVIPRLNAFEEGSAHWVMHLSLGFGALHLGSAHLWAGLRHRSWQSLSELGWIGIIAGLYGIATNLLLGGEHWAWMIWSVSVGLFLVLVFGGQRNDGFGSGLRRGLSQLPVDLLTGIGCFSDVISYIRLFAVGLATKEVAVTFNDMAANVGWNHVGAAIGFSLILILGHTVNLLLAAMGVLVHGLRLNLLEFSRHMNLNWSGIPYQPFRRLKQPVKSDELLQGSKL